MEEQNAASRKKTSKAASTEAKVKDCEKWSVYNSFFFSFTVITTIGYGKIAPETQGRVFHAYSLAAKWLFAPLPSKHAVRLSNFDTYLWIKLIITNATRYAACPARERSLHIVFAARGPHQWHPHRNAWGFFRQKGNTLFNYILYKATLALVGLVVCVLRTSITV